MSESNELLDSIMETAKFVAGDKGSKDYDLEYVRSHVNKLTS